MHRRILDRMSKYGKICVVGVDDVARLRLDVEPFMAEFIKEAQGKTTRMPSANEVLGYAMASNLLDYLGRYAEAKKVIEACARVFGGAKNKADINAALSIAFGRMAYRDHAYETALRYLEPALAHCQEENDKVGEALVHFEVSRVFNRVQDQEKAKQAIRRSMTLFKEALPRAESAHRLGLCNYLLASIAHAQGRFEKAVYLLGEARDGIHPNDLVHVGRVAQMEGRIYRANSNYDKAEEFFETAKQLFEQCHHQTYLGSVLNDLGHLHMRLEQLKKADDELKSALMMDTEGVNKPKTLYFQARLGLHAFNLAPHTRTARQTLEDAAAFADQAIAAAKEVKALSLVAQARITRGRIVLAMTPEGGDVLRAEELAFEARACNLDADQQPISTKTQIAFNLLMAETHSRGSFPLPPCAMAYVRIARRLMKKVATEFLTKWADRIEAIVNARDASFRAYPPAPLEEGNRSLDRYYQRFLLWLVLEASKLVRVGDAEVNIERMEPILDIKKGTINLWLKNWREDEKNKRRLLGLTPEALEDLLAEYGLNRVPRPNGPPPGARAAETNVR